MTLISVAGCIHYNRHEYVPIPRILFYFIHYTRTRELAQEKDMLSNLDRPVLVVLWDIGV